MSNRITVLSVGDNTSAEVSLIVGALNAKGIQVEWADIYDLETNPRAYMMVFLTQNHHEMRAGTLLGAVGELMLRGTVRVVLPVLVENVSVPLLFDKRAELYHEDEMEWHFQLGKLVRAIEIHSARFDVD